MTESTQATLTTPTAVADIDVDWITKVLRSHNAIAEGGSVDSVVVRQIAEGVGFVSAVYRVTLTGTGVPPTLIVKLPADGHFRQLAVDIRMYVRELTFYREVAERSPIDTAYPYLAAGASGPDDAAEFVLVLEDLGELTAISQVEGLPLDIVEQCIDQLAAHHAWATRSGVLGEVSASLPRVNDPIMLGLYGFGLPTGWDIYCANAHVAPSAAVQAMVGALSNQISALADGLSEPETVVHGDFRADNLFFRPDGRCVVIDHQMAMRGSGLYDVAYFLSKSVAEEVRSGRDHELIERYCASLASHGAPRDFADVWRQYQEALALTLTGALAAISAWEGLPANGREMCLVLVERSIKALEDTDAIAVLARQ